MGEMRLGNNAAGDGLCVLEGGSLTVDDLDTGPGTGRICIDGGALWLAGATAGIQTLDIGGGTASVGWFDPGDVHLTVETLNIGINGTGTLAQDENLIDVTAALTVAHTGPGTVEQTGGNHIIVNLLQLGYTSTGEGVYTQSGGDCTVRGDAYVAYGAGSTGGYTLGGGPLEGITQQVDGDLHIGYGEGSEGTYIVEEKIYHVGSGWTHAGELTVAGTVHVGASGSGRLEVRAAGKLIANGAGGTLGGEWINRGQLRISSGTFHLNAPLNGGADRDGTLAVDNATLHANQPVEASGITVSGTLHVAADIQSACTEVQHAGAVYQSGGEVDAGDLTIIEGSHELAGPGNLTSGEVKALGDFTHLSAVHTADVVRIGGDNWGYLLAGEYAISGGRLEVGSLYVGEQGWVDPFFPELGGPDIPGTLALTDASVEVYVSERLVLSPAATIEAAPGAVIHMTGSDFENQSQTPADLADLAHVEMVFEGGADDLDPFEVAGEDRRQLPRGLRNNFALGTLTVGGTGIGQVQLVDLVDNHPAWEGAESLYLHRLDVAAGSSLDLNGLSLYYEEGSIDPDATILGGSVMQIYEPATSISIDGLPEGSDVAMTPESGGSGGMGTAGMTDSGQTRALSCTVRLDETDVAEAIAALGGGDAFITVNIHYDPAELAILELDENSLRPYWWNESGEEWVLCGTTTAGLTGEGLFAGINENAADYGIGYCGLDTEENLLWANINHASTYGAGGTPEPATLSLLALGGLAVLRRRSHRRRCLLRCDKSWRRARRAA